MSRWRHARAIALLPSNVTIVVPAIILIAGQGPNVGWGLEGLAAVVPVLLGVVLITTGVALWAWTVQLFARIGQGTLTAWDATRRLVVAGPYRYVRNPMITAVLGVLLGETALFASPALLIWCAAFLAINWIYFVMYEEPGLERRFGEEYRLYKLTCPAGYPAAPLGRLRRPNMGLTSRTEFTFYLLLLFDEAPASRTLIQPRRTDGELRARRRAWLRYSDDRRAVRWDSRPRAHGCAPLV
jgi:protein-S-isoprenylcysteine O-methyltransferase Ste14